MPRNEREIQLCKIFAEILNLDNSTISIDADFFQLGGNSILAIKLIGKINRLFKKKITATNIFIYRTIRQLSDNISKQIEDVKISKYNFISDELQLLSYAQERLWFIDAYQNGSSIYNIPIILKLKESTNIDILILAFRDILTRHEVLRSVINTNNDGHTYQLVMESENIAIEKMYYDSEENFKSLISDFTKYIFNLHQEFPVKIQLFFNEKNQYFCIVFHHIVFDGWSYEILLRELVNNYQLYKALKEKNKSVATQFILQPLPIQYKDFAIWQRNYLTGSVLDEHMDYWKNKLSGIETLNLKTDKDRPPQINYNGANVFFDLNQNVSNGLRNIAKQLSTSLFSVLLSAYYLTLKCFSNQNDIIIGTPIANRNYNDIENLIGFFVNSLVLRQSVDSNDNIASFINQVTTTIIEAQLHQDLPFEKLVEVLDVEKDTSRHPIFQVMFAVEIVNNIDNVIFEPIKIEDVIDYNVAKFDLTTFLYDNGDNITGAFNYATSLFSQKTIQSYVNVFKNLLVQISILDLTDCKQKKIKDFCFLNTQTYNQIVYEWNRTQRSYLSNRTIHSIFEEQVEKTPDNIAVIYENIRLTYKELNERSNQLAAYLIDVYDVYPDDLIALCLDRSEHMLIAIMAVLKSGGAYVPIEPNTPDDRIAYILSDTRSKVILCNTQNKEKLQNNKNINATIENIDNAVFESHIQKSYATTNIENKANAHSLAYVIYTSGTTGIPKGVMIEHKNVNNLIIDTNYINIDESDNILSLSSYQFDASIYDFFGSLLNGACLVLSTKESFLDLDELNSLIGRYNITNFFTTTVLFNSIVDARLSNLKNLKSLIFGGE
ncbi:MAG: condensation domain-containing protein, partial [Bacteroidales bacterium]|nr:condensation domain-containing protein [Bacteroidales bacterium]